LTKYGTMLSHKNTARFVIFPSYQKLHNCKRDGGPEHYRQKRHLVGTEKKRFRRLQSQLKKGQSGSSPHPRRRSVPKRAKIAGRERVHGMELPLVKYSLSSAKVTRRRRLHARGWIFFTHGCNPSREISARVQSCATYNRLAPPCEQLMPNVIDKSAYKMFARKIPNGESRRGPRFMLIIVCWSIDDRST
jgi:hypothetical protein